MPPVSSSGAESIRRRGVAKPFGITEPVTTGIKVMGIKKIVSGGQTGADRAALDFAIAHQIPHGGWCPKGRKCEDGTLADRYELKETPSNDYPQRTEWNVRDSDGTVIFSIAPVLTGGSKQTVNLAMKHQKPLFHI